VGSKSTVAEGELCVNGREAALFLGVPKKVVADIIKRGGFPSTQWDYQRGRTRYRISVKELRTYKKQEEEKRRIRIETLKNAKSKPINDGNGESLRITSRIEDKLDELITKVEIVEDRVSLIVKMFEQ
jgi:hypothetical protein